GGGRLDRPSFETGRHCPWVVPPARSAPILSPKLVRLLEQVHMSRIVVFATSALVVAASSVARAQASHPVSGVEQARADSLRHPYTSADIDFMSGMIGHHAQAVKMASWAESHNASKSLQIFCGRVAMAQTAEIGLMSAWLKDRNQAVPEPDPRGMKMKMG